MTQVMIIFAVFVMVSLLLIFAKIYYYGEYIESVAHDVDVHDATIYELKKRIPENDPLTTDKYCAMQRNVENCVRDVGLCYNGVQSWTDELSTWEQRIAALERNCSTETDDTAKKVNQ